MTVEDPVEYRLENVNQVQTNPKAGLTFANALRSILRQDPDIILVGEVRDRETGVIAIEAALTGHLVLTTLHTNDAASTPLRLIEMGIEPFLVTSSVDCVLAQRLARRLCERCKLPYVPTEAELVAAKWDFSRVSTEGLALYRAVGCPQCGGTGFRGRLALHEVMLMTEELDSLVVARASSEDIRRVATDQGMMELRCGRTRQGRPWHHHIAGGFPCRCLTRMDWPSYRSQRHCCRPSRRMRRSRSTSTSCSNSAC